MDLRPADLVRLASRGIPAAAAAAQLDRLRRPPAPARLARPCTVGDGIERLAPEREATLAALAEAARAAGRLARFVPASGAATRMFRALAATLERPAGCTRADLERDAVAGDALAAEAVAFLDALPRLALARALARVAGEPLDRLLGRAAAGPVRPLVELVLSPAGLDAARLPKGLLPFHARGAEWVSAFEEQLAEGADLVADGAGRCRFHFTVPPGAGREAFEAALAEARHRLERDGRRLDVDFSEQEPATDALALDERGAPARDAQGELVLRPSGHGALLGNLGRAGFDLATVKNIDNILPRERHAEVNRWKRVLIGRLLELEAELAPLRRALAAGDDPAAAEAAFELCAARFGRRPPAAAAEGGAAGRAAAARDLVERPLRVCGVVANTGEPGGGPFWIAGADGEPTPQIVESSQVDGSDPAQLAIFRASTHFNPVDLALALRDAAGRPYPLERFVDPETAFVARKSEGGRELTVLERPGLWNGAMAGWNTCFVEVPGATFAPVKSVLDLARPDHRAG